MDIKKKEISIAVCGPVDAGKSSLIGVITSGDLDNGRGVARNKILKHQHELDSGQTSNITINPIKYITNNNKVNLVATKTKKTNERVIKEIDIEDNYINSNLSEKVISFIDLAGHQKYLKTTVFGVSSMFPDRGIIVIGANSGITRLTREHLGILLYLKIPFIITITKIDLAPREIYKKLCNRIKNLLMKKSFGKIIYFISDSEKKNDETKYYLDNMINNPEVIPVISISNKEGTNINNLHKILYSLPNTVRWNNENINGTIVYLDSNYNVPGTGLVVSGTIKGNSINVKQKMYLGPFNGEFFPVIIRSIHNSTREEVNIIHNNVQGCFSIRFINNKEITRSQIKKGCVLIDDINNWKNNIVRKFTARITVLHHSATITTGYSPVIHCGPIRQTASIRLLDKDEYLKSNDNSLVEFTFKTHKEFIELGMILFFRDGNTKGIGEVISITNKN